MPAERARHRRDVDTAVDRLRAGGVVAVPTETVYGLAADAENPAAVARIFEIKGRPAGHPLIVHLADADAAAASGRGSIPRGGPCPHRGLLAGTAHRAPRTRRPCARRRHRRAAGRRDPRAVAPADAGAARPLRRRARGAVGEPVRAGQPDHRRPRRRRPRRAPRPGARRDPRRRADARRCREHDRRLHRRAAPDPAARRHPDRGHRPPAGRRGRSPPPDRHGRAGCWTRTTRRAAQVRLADSRHRPSRSSRRCGSRASHVDVLDTGDDLVASARNLYGELRVPTSGRSTSSSPCSRRRTGSATRSATGSRRPRLARPEPIVMSWSQSSWLRFATHASRTASTSGSRSSPNVATAMLTVLAPASGRRSSRHQQSNGSTRCDLEHVRRIVDEHLAHPVGDDDAAPRRSRPAAPRP